MVNIYLNCKGVDIVKSICWILSVISWLSFLITGWISIFGNDDNIWTIRKNVKYKLTILRKTVEFYPYIPIQMEELFIFIIFILTLAISTSAFIIYVIFIFCFKIDSVYNGMMGNISKFHFISFFCGFALFIIGQEINDSDNQKDLLIVSLIFSVIGLFSLILFHFKTIIEHWYASLLIKRGAFSCLIALFTYSICYTILHIGMLEEMENFDIYTLVNLIKGENKIIDKLNNCGIALPLTIGIVNIGLSFALKDIMISVMNLLIFIGMAIFYNKVDDDTKQFINNSGDGVIDIIMIVLSAITIILLIFIETVPLFKKCLNIK